MSRITAFCEWLLRQPVVWGGMACFAFQVVVVQNLDPTGNVHRWFAGGGAMTTVVSLLFFVGLATLGMRAFSLLMQFGSMENLLRRSAEAGDSPKVAAELLAELEQAPRSLQQSYLVRRLHVAVTGDGSDGAEVARRLQRQADVDRQSIRSHYGAVRTIAVAIPAIGLLGAITVIAAGVPTWSAAAASDTVGTTAMQIALATLSQAMATSICLAFAKLGVEHFEGRLLDAVDEAISRQFGGSVKAYASHDPHSAAVIRQCERLLETVETAVARHDGALNKTIVAAGRRWEETASAAAALLHRTVGEALTVGMAKHAEVLNVGVAKHTDELRNVLVRHAEILSDNIDQHTGALAEALEHHTAVITHTETQLAADNRRHIGELEGALGEAVLVAVNRQEKLIQQSEDLLRDLQTALVETAGMAVAHQEQLTRQSEVLLKVVDATGQVRKLEEVLNSNLTTLAESHHFQETVLSLSATLQLLSANLGRPSHGRDEINLMGAQRTSHAA